MTKQNKSYSYIGISFVILVFGIWVIPKIIDRISGDNDNLVIIGDAPNFNFTNQDKQTISQKDYENKVYVVEFFFTSCPGICIVMNNNMSDIQQSFLGNPHFGIASITIDPKRDTPEKLKTYAEKHQAGPYWHFMTGDIDTIYELANKGFNLYAGLNPNIEGGFEHSGMFALIDKKGRIRSRRDDNGNPIVYYDGTDPKQVNMLKKDIEKLL